MLLFVRVHARISSAALHLSAVTIIALKEH